MSLGVQAFVLATALAFMFLFLAYTDGPQHSDLHKADLAVFDQTTSPTPHSIAQSTHSVHSPHSAHSPHFAHAAITEHGTTNASPFKFLHHPFSIIGYCIIFLATALLIVLLVRLKQNNPPSPA